MQSPETALDNIRHALDNQSLSLDQLDHLTRLVANARRDAQDKRRRHLATADPQELMPGNWGMYGVYEADFVNDADFVKATDAFENAKTALDKAGCRVVRMIRGGNLTQIKLAVNDVRLLQTKFSEFGAADSEGRHALQNVMAKACNGTVFELDGLWELCWI